MSLCTLENSAIQKLSIIIIFYFCLFVFWGWVGVDLCVYAHVGACVRACVRACVCVCVGACVCARARAHAFGRPSSVNRVFHHTKSVDIGNEVEQPILLDCASVPVSPSTH